MSDDRSSSSGAAAGSTGAVTNWNLPNALTTLRILLVPLFGWLLLYDDGQDTTYRIWAFVVFTLAILTDRIDGDIARRRNMVTDFGKLMDPIADKALTGMAFVGLSIIGELWWWVTIVVLGRELGITLMRFWIIKYGVMPASRGGKIKTTLQAVALCGLILPLRDLEGAWSTFGDVLWWAAVVVMAAAVVVTVVTGVDYVREAVKLRREGQAAQQLSS
jgi:CDP-diacylglycerol--glycerol-3-phosphate 3-phosphatidyltransferase